MVLYELRFVVRELVERSATTRLLVTAVAADVADFDDAEFHDRLLRVKKNVSSRISTSVWSVLTLLTGLGLVWCWSPSRRSSSSLRLLGSFRCGGFAGATVVRSTASPVGRAGGRPDLRATRGRRGRVQNP